MHLLAPWLARPADLGRADVELGRLYPEPIVDHAQARARTLARYAGVRKSLQPSTVAAQ
jgi:deoxyribodipyrimidine photo-lyase